MSTPITRGPDCWPPWISALLAAFASTSCAASSAAHTPCPSDAWLGTCRLVTVTKVEDREMPLPYVVYEAIYAPEANRQFPQFTPLEARMRFGAPARYEFALSDQLKAQARVACHAKAVQGSCLPGEVIADVAQFDPERTQAAEAPHISGCAAIDAASEQDRLAKSRSEAAAISERFVFAAGSSALPPEATTTGSAVARRLAAEPSLECLGIVGQIGPGESPSLAEARARAVKQLLISLGVDAKRLETIAATASVYARTANAPTDEPESRRVSLSVLLKTAEKAGP